MKTILPALFLLLLVSCTKESVAPAKADNQSVTTAAVSYKDNSISVINFKARPTDKGIEVIFTTLFEKNIVKLEVLRGCTATNLCSIYQQSIMADSYAVNQYSTYDFNDSKAAALYYMVKYTLASGDWGYTPVFKLAL